MFDYQKVLHSTSNQTGLDSLIALHISGAHIQVRHIALVNGMGVTAGPCRTVTGVVG